MTASKDDIAAIRKRAYDTAAAMRLTNGTVAQWDAEQAVRDRSALLEVLDTADAWNWCPHCRQLVDADDITDGSEVRCLGCDRQYVCVLCGTDPGAIWALEEVKPDCPECEAADVKAEDAKAALAHAERERDEARDWVRKMTKQNVVTCVYCGHEYPPGAPTSGAEALTEHVRVCEKHPMRAVENALRNLLHELPRCGTPDCNGVAVWGYISHEPHYCNGCRERVAAELGPAYVKRTSIAEEVAAAEALLRGSE